MCDPLTAIAAAATIGGTVMNQQQQNAAIKANRAAQEDAAARSAAYRRQEMERQEAIRRESAATAAGTQEAFAPAATMQGQDQAAAARFSNIEQSLGGLDPAGDVDRRLLPSGSAGASVVADGAKGLATALARTRAQLRDGAFLSGVGDTVAGQQRRLAVDNSTLANQGLARQGSLAAYGVERNRAVPSFSTGSTLLGDTLIAGGTLGANYAGRQAGAAAGKAALAPAPT